MDLEYIRSFYLAATLKNLKLVADKQYIGQPAVSWRLAVLEEHLGTPLFDRRRDRHIRLTPAGVRFLADAERLLKLWGEIKEGLGSGTQRPVSLRVGAIESVLHSWLIPWIQRLRMTQPWIEFELTIETTPMLLDLVQKGALDLVVAAQPVHADRVHTRALPAMQMVFVGKRTLHKQPRYTLAQLAQYELLTFQRGSQPHVALLDTLRAEGIKDARVHAISSVSAMVRLVADGFGVATLPLGAIDHFAKTEGLRRLPCQTELPSLPIHASWRPDPTSNVIDTIAASVGPPDGDSQPKPRTHRKHR
jgi:DNA-binding transcriptional LysR family regulator